MVRDLLIEIGTEEIPAAFFPRCLEELERLILEGLDEARLEHRGARRLGTPRRLAILVSEVALRQPDLSKEEVGPPVRVAFDAEGKPTRAGEAFAKKLGVEIEALERKTTPKGEYLAGTVDVKGLPAQEILPGILLEAIRQIPWRKSMRWGHVKEHFARPIHWILTRYGDEVIPLSFAEVESGGSTMGHRFHANHSIEIPNPAAYVPALEAADVIVDPEVRREAVLQAAEQGAARAGGKLLMDEELLDHVTWLVERPFAITGAFEPSYLELPQEVLVSEMKGHQKYFSVTSTDGGSLLPAFVAVANTKVADPQLAKRGFERVLAARLSDGQFFFDEDRKQPLIEQVPKLDKVTFQQKLGSVGEKVSRIRTIASWLASTLQLSPEAQGQVERAATLSKADLVTGMVGEFPELQGSMGRAYALASGEAPEVATAIFEHYLPRGHSDELPTSDVGALVGIADRIDTIAGIFGVGKPPTGTADPFGLRRASLGIIHVVLARGYRFSLSELVRVATQQLESKLGIADGLEAQILDFFRGRLRSLWSEEHPVEVVEAVLDAGFDDLVAAHQRLRAVDAMLGDAAFRSLAEGFSRTNIVEKAEGLLRGDVDPNLFENAAEGALHECLLAAREQVASELASGDYPKALEALTSLRQPLDTFFNEVMVMADEASIRENRLRLLSELRELFGQIADFGRMDLKRPGSGR